MNNNPLFYQAYHPDDRERIPVVLVHGAGGSRLHWPGELRRLEGCRVFTVDLPGHGRSGGTGRAEISAYGEALLNWAQSLELPPAVWIGHSMGGAISLWTAVHHPERVRALVLIGTGGHLPVNPRLLEMLADPAQVPAALQKIIHWSFGRETDPEIIQQSREKLKEVPQPVLLSDFRACSRYDLRSRLGEIRAPALILVGGADEMTPPALSKELKARLSKARLEVIPEAGHMVMLEKSAALGRQVELFLKRLESR